jgi:hypothetical protein
MGEHQSYARKWPHAVSPEIRSADSGLTKAGKTGHPASYCTTILPDMAMPCTAQS